MRGLDGVPPAGLALLGLDVGPPAGELDVGLDVPAWPPADDVIFSSLLAWGSARFARRRAPIRLPPVHAGFRLQVSRSLPLKAGEIAFQSPAQWCRY